MAIKLKDPDHRTRLSGAIKRSFELGSCERNDRADLISIYKDRPKMVDLLLDDRTRTAYLNLFAMYVRGHIIKFAYRAPRWAVNARCIEGKGFDKKAQKFLEQYASLLNFANLLELWAIDSAFGRSVAKIITSIAPKGVASTTAPRCYRLCPDHFIPDRSAPSIEECTYKCDMYFVDLDEARAHPFFDEERRGRLAAWTAGGTHSSAFMGNTADSNLFATDQTRLIDVYIPTLGVIATWPCPDDSFGHIANEEPLQVIPALADPYVVLDMLTTPDDLESISRLGQLRQLNMLANHLYEKVAEQAKRQQDNPVANLGDDLDAATLDNAADGQLVLMNNTKALDVFHKPGPDGAVMAMANDAAAKFSDEAGNLATSLGISPGANTARQTQALIGQISQADSVDRMKFERFFGEIGKRILTFAWFDDCLRMNYAVRIPGTQYHRNEGWGPAELMPRVGQVDDYTVESVPYSTAFRGPQERLQQLVQASGIVGGFMAQKAQGYPVNLEVIIEDCAESFDLIPNLVDWWTGQEPTPQEKTGQMYQSMAGPAQGSNVNYSGVGNSGGGGAAGQNDYASAPAGLSSAGAGV